jgi:two-component system cell cycle sensor histidine kinase PleC
VGFPQQWRIKRSTDVRVLKAQLDLTALSVRATRLSTPLWALALALIGSSIVGVFGHRSFSETIFLPVIVSVVMIFSASMTSIYQHDTAQSDDYDEVAPWFGRITAMQATISAAWGVLPWLFWDGASEINHLFIVAAMLTVVAGLVVSRGSHMDMLAASLVPVSLSSAVRLALGGTVLDFCLAAIVPLFALLMWANGRPLIRRMDEDSRLRFQVEDLARELEETRDDALRKRFEAETANASKTAFLANMSHELRTPLNAILGFSEIIAQECFGPVGSDRYREYAGDIHSSGAHLLSLINDLLDVAKIEAGKMDIQPSLLDARRTFDIALKLIASKAREKHQELIIEIDPSAPALYADERALKQVLINLVSNAVKFTPEGGRITVVGSLARGGEFQIMVQDNGPGIAREKLDKIFTPFSQVDNRYDRQAGGTGLGLALVRGLAELHGGRAWLESETGKGCAAYVVLPVPDEMGSEDRVAVAEG